jgi:uncharacterized protein YjiK
MIYGYSTLFLTLIGLSLISNGCKLDGAKNFLTEIENQNPQDPSVDLFGNSDKLNYNFAHPDLTLVLDRELRETSALSYNYDNNTLLTVGDEKGYYYVLDINDGSIIEKVKFHGDGDYESIEYVGSDVIVARSSGHLYVKNSKAEKAEKINTELSKKNNVEGMAYLPSDNALLLACKGRPFIDKGNDQDKKAIYKFSLSNNKLDENPYLMISIKDLESYAKNNLILGYDYTKDKIKNRVEEFSPSGLAIHPETEDIYIISARGSILTIFDKSGNLKDIAMLYSKVMPQPEGITFDENNNLYISTEGKGNSGKILKFVSQ